MRTTRSGKAYSPATPTTAVSSAECEGTWDGKTHYPYSRKTRPTPMQEPVDDVYPSPYGHYIADEPQDSAIYLIAAIAMMAGVFFSEELHRPEVLWGIFRLVAMTSVGVLLGVCLTQ